jgi:hypothetical protein
MFGQVLNCFFTPSGHGIRGIVPEAASGVKFEESAALLYSRDIAAPPCHFVSPCFRE